MQVVCPASAARGHPLAQSGVYRAALQVLKHTAEFKALATVEGQLSIERRRNLLLCVALGYTIFVVYGSLVPLDFHPRPLAEALTAFRDIRYLQLNIASRADWVANILLFIPLAWLWLALMWPEGRFTQLFISALVGLVCAGLSIAIEFTQLFFPPRTVSINDVVAEAIGAATGIVLWWVTRYRVMAWLNRWSWVSGTSAVSELLLSGYLIMLLGYNMLPLDLTISLVEIAHKWKEGRVLIIPFGANHQNTAQMIYDLTSDIAIWIPVAFLWLLSGRTTERKVFAYVVICAATIEFLQLFVYSRISDTTDVLTAAIGGWLGIVIARRVPGTNTHSDRNLSAPLIGQHHSIWLFTTVAWLCILAIVFWYPFDFQNDWTFIHQRLNTLRRVPFEAYYWGSEYRAITEAIHKAGFFFPLGSLFAIGVIHLRARLAIPLGFLHVVSAGLIAAVAATIEAGQLLLPDRSADVTDWALETLGGLGGYVLLIFVFPRLRNRTRNATDGQREDTRAQIEAPIRLPLWPMTARIAGPPRIGFGTRKPARVKIDRKPLGHILFGVTLCALVAWVATHTPAMPYNVRELPDPGHAVLSIIVLAVVLYWSFGFPVVFAHSLTRGGPALWWYPAIVPMHGFFAWAMLHFAVPAESIHDVVGSPILKWPWEFELAGRFMALFGGLSLTLTGAVIVVAGMRGAPMARAMLCWTTTATVLLPVSYWVVVTKASTDNLTELMAGAGTFESAAWLAGYLFVIGLAGALLGATGRGAPGRVRYAAILVGLAALPLAYFLLTQGTEIMIIKYGKAFSALQFLFSTDRTHYASGLELAQRYLIFHVSVTAMIAFVQYPFWMVTERSPSP